MVITSIIELGHQNQKNKHLGCFDFSSINLIVEILYNCAGDMTATEDR